MPGIMRNTPWIGNVSLQKRLVLAATSAIFVWPLFPLGEWIRLFLPEPDILDAETVLGGGIFGVLVLVPFVTSNKYRIGRIVGLIVCSILIYWFAGELAAGNAMYRILGSTDAAILVSGVIGAMLVGIATRLIAPLQVSWKYWLYVPVAGFFGGLMFTLLPNGNVVLAVTLAYGSWQIPVCLAMHYGRVKDI